MKRFILYLLLVPIIGQIVTVVIQAVEYAVMYGSNIFDLLLDPSLYFLWSTSLLWLVPALAVATTDRLLGSDKWQRLGIIAAAGGVSTFLTGAALYGLLRGWRLLLPGLNGAITALVCCLQLNQLSRERLKKYGSTIHKTIKALRQWPETI